MESVHEAAEKLVVWPPASAAVGTLTAGLDRARDALTGKVPTPDFPTASSPRT